MSDYYLEGNTTLISNGRTYAGKLYKKTNFVFRNTIQGKFIKSSLTISSHSNFDAFFESTMLTLCSVLTIYATISRSFTSVSQLVANRSVKEAFTPLACEHTIVTARRRRVAHSAVNRLFWVIVPINLVKL